ncbi:segregation/condensation protein A [Halapricum desulfuricans]|uniref:Chromatin segregation and condensation protein Rec8/ScpA/Scc1, kleisin family n=1 Tax=Halapricum desulfuricans TaxID=2841257 RepID=A0A897NRQ2_9EURY|nr:ScpA family protein [Halapricum desulfuricans]QSG15477.1 Chromatin segregation and condensation protein Rec8/ScpA/Scc1, kleisin family [Halapricum desulfuricans]
MTDDEIPLDITGHETREEPDDDRSLPDGGTSVLAGGKSGDPGGPPEPDGTPGDDVEPVEVLVQLAEDGEIDPWDIDVVRVTDKFLDALEEADLRTSGRALFYASVLVRMKSDAMLDDGESADQGPADGDDPWVEPLGEDELGVDPFDQLDAEIDRRLERKRARGMPQTLDELVRELRDAERGTWWKESREYDTSDSPHGYQRGTQQLDYRSADDLRMDEEPTAAEVTGTAHAENIDEIIGSVERVLNEQYNAGRSEVLYREISDVTGSRVETFLGLLFLSHRGEVLLSQDDLFGDLWIQDPTASGAGPASDD